MSNTERNWASDPTVDDFRTEVSAMEDGIAEELRKNPLPAFLRPLFAAGYWLEERMLADGHGRDACQGACEALGQRIFAAGLDGAPRLAVEAYARTKQGVKDVPGRKLADDLISGRENP